MGLGIVAPSVQSRAPYVHLAIAMQDHRRSLIRKSRRFSPATGLSVGVVGRSVLQIRPAYLLLGLLRIHLQHPPQTPNLALQTRNDGILLTPLISPQSIRSPDHFATAHVLREDIILLKTARKVLVLLLLQEGIVVTALLEEAALNRVAVVADGFGGVAHGVLVNGDQAGVFFLLVLVGVDDGVLLGELTLKFADAGFYIGD
jgi:hypothetical protein